MDTPFSGSSPCTPPDGQNLLNMHIKQIITSLDSPVAGTTPSEKHDDQPTAETANQGVLADVVAYVEVRANNENRSRCIIKELVKLGATVVPKFTKEVTHVVFKEGKKSTREKAAKKGVHLVSVLWVDSCKRTQSKVAEDLYQPILPDDDGTPLIIGRYKKARSMQPNDFDEDVANSAERWKKKRQRQANADKWKVLESPYSPHLPRTVYAAETQPLSPHTMDMSFSPGISIPDTPPSMRRKIQELRLRSSDHSDAEDVVSTPVVKDKPTPLQRRLFEAKLNAMEGFGEKSNKSAENSPSISTDFENTCIRVPGDQQSSADPQSSDDTDNTVGSPKNAARTKRKLLGTVGDVLPPSELPAPSKASSSTPPRLPSPSVSKRKDLGRQICNGSDSGSDDSRDKKRKAENLSGSDSGEKTLPRKRVCITDTTQQPAAGDGSHRGAAPTVTTRVTRAARRQSIASSTPSRGEPLQAAGRVNRQLDGTPKRSRGRRSMAVLPASSQVRAAPLIPEEPEVNAEVPPGERKLPAQPKQTVPKDVKEVVPASKANRRRSTRLLNKDLPLPNSDVLASLNCDATLVSAEPSLPTDAVQPGSASEGKCPADFDSTAEDSIVLEPPKRRILKTMSSARKKPAKATRDDYPPMNKLGQQVARPSQVAATPPTLTCLAHSRRSLEEFHPSQMMQKRRAGKLPTIETSDEDGKKPTPSTKSRKKDAHRRSRSPSSSSCSSSGVKNLKKNVNRPAHSITTTSMHFDEAEVVRAVVKKLGGYRIVSNVCDNTTHVICGEARRTLNVLYAIVRGAWLISKEWALESLEAGEWLDEEAFELHDYFPAAQASRLKRVSCGKERYTCSIFTTCGIIYIADQTSPPHHHLVALVKLAGGQITQCTRKADICVGRGIHTEKPVVTEQWVLDSITSNRCLPITKQYLTRDRQIDREASPDF